MFGNSPYDLVAPAMIAELHRGLKSEAVEDEAAIPTRPDEVVSLPQRIMAVLTPRQLRLAPDAECVEG